jgi:hypothetical protein
MTKQVKLVINSTGETAKIELKINSKMTFCESPQRFILVGQNKKKTAKAAPSPGSKINEFSP